MSFDPNQFLQTTYSEATSTEYILVPEGEYPAIADKIGFRSVARTDGSGDMVFLDVSWAVDDQRVKEITQRDKNLVRQSIILDLTSEGNLDLGKGKNVPLGRLRTAIKQNQAGRPWAFGQIVGNAAKITVKHRMDGDTTYVDVKQVAPL